MFRSLAAVVIRRRVAVLVAALVAFAVAGSVGGGVAENLTTGGFADPDAESTIAAAQLDDTFGQGAPNLVLLVTAPDGVDAPAVAEQGLALTTELAGEPEIESAVSYWSLRAPPLASTDGTQAMVLARITGNEDEVAERVGELAPAYTRDAEGFSVAVGGSAETFHQVGANIERDLIRAETIAVPITLVALLFVFGSVVAALLPLVVGVLAVVGTFLILQLLTGVTDVSIYALNLTTALGLGLAIDYSLFVVSRFREELAGGREPRDAVAVTVRTAGKTVAFSAATVAISLSALLVFPMPFLRSFAYAGIGVVAWAAVGAVVVLPALLAVLGHRVDALRIGRRRDAGGSGRRHRVATTVMRRPIPIATVVVVFLLVLGAPFLGAEFGLPDDRVLPEGTAVRDVAQDLRDNFGGEEADSLAVVAATAGDPAAAADAIDGYAASLSAVAGVARVDAVTGSYIDGARAAPANPMSARFAAEQGTWLSVVPSVEPVSAEGERLVADVRGTPAPFDVMVGGSSAELVDAKSSVFSRLPLAVGIIAVVTFTLLFLMFGSLLVPAKALVLNTLSLTAMFGAMVWIFQDGNLSGLLDFTATGLLDTTMPILMFCIAFGLSMDYEVFLLSRIAEEYERTGDNAASVAAGLERTGRIVTAAAGLLAVVFIAFATSGITFIKLFGVGLALAVVMDATLVRATLVPAFMGLAGEANWWAPRPLRRLHARFGISERDDIVVPPPPVPPVPAVR